MPEVLLFGATGYTGRLAARALSDAGASFALAGRNAAKLEDVAATTGAPEVRVASVEDVDSVVSALDDVAVLVSCVGPFAELGTAAARAALLAGCHYVDSSGEAEWVAHLLEEFDEPARKAGIAMAPALGFDEVPADVAATLAVAGLDAPELTLTYALGRAASAGTVRSSLRIVTTRGPWIENGRRRPVGWGEERRWGPMPAPLGPRRAISAPFAVTHLAPLHLELASLRTYVTAGPGMRAALRTSKPILRMLGAGPLRDGIVKAITRGAEGPDEDARRASKWTILAEARSAAGFRNVVLTGADAYGLSAVTLAAAAVHMAAPGFSGSGVLAPVQAAGLELLRKQMAGFGVVEEIFEATG